MGAIRVWAVVDVLLWIGAGFVALALVPALLLMNVVDGRWYRGRMQP